MILLDLVQFLIDLAHESLIMLEKLSMSCIMIIRMVIWIYLERNSFIHGSFEYRDHIRLLILDDISGL